MHTPDTSERRGGIRATASPARWRRRDRHGRSKPQGFGGDWQLLRTCPGGVGLDDWTALAGQEPKGGIVLKF
ncbi:hypothetical protein FCK19_20110 [Salmonella enterica]|nr:hypothetical protein [Salmonella enterica]